MTNEEITKGLKAIDEECGKHFNESGAWMQEFLHEAIKALEQEPILDKIRAEIIELRSQQNVGVCECLDIIDKHRAESEDKE